MWGDHTLMYNLMKQHALPHGVFAFYMADDGSGYLTIGRGIHPPFHSSAHHGACIPQSRSPFQPRYVPHLKPAPTRLLTGSARSPLPRAVGPGGANSTLFHGDLHWVPVKRPLYWEVQLDSVKVGEVVAEATHSHGGLDDPRTIPLLCSRESNLRNDPKPGL